MTERKRYRAFISYSHADEVHAAWLQRALERYRPPTALRSSRPDLPARLFPVFRDSAELATSNDLQESIQRALDDSDALIVVCSPAARASRWVNEEIRQFRASGRGDRIFCLMVAGSPDPAAADYAFPAALLQHDEDLPQHEPLAADVTAAGGGKRDALLRIAAGLLGVGIDELKRRDAQRQARFWSLVASGSLLVAAVTVGLALYAQHARREADIRRLQAESLITYMLGDLRSNLEPIGKLALLDSIGTQAMAYFAAIGERGTDKEMLERAKALKQIGDVRFSRGQLELALEAFRQALSQTRALYETDPANNDYLFELGQAEFWVGYVAWQRGDLDGAYEAMQRYMQHSRELSLRAPDNDDYALEFAYAYNNLGSVALAQGRLEAALENFRAALEPSKTLLAKNPDDYILVSAVAEAHSWLGSTLIRLHRLAEGREEVAKAIAVMRPLHETGQDSRASADYGRHLTIQADADINMGKVDDARRALEESLRVFNRLREGDPSNTIWLFSALSGELSTLSLVPPDEWTAEQHAHRERIESSLRDALELDPLDKDYIRLQFRLRQMRNTVLLHEGNPEVALGALRQTEQDWQSASAGKTIPEYSVIQASIGELLGNALAATGDVAAARATWQAEADRLDAAPIINLTALAIRRLLAINLGDSERANEIGAQLEAAGYRDPRTDPARTLSGSFR